jgi:hypothetical protein
VIRAASVEIGIRPICGGQVSYTKAPLEDRIGVGRRLLELAGTAAYGAERKDVTLPTDFRSPP